MSKHAQGGLMPPGQIYMIGTGDRELFVPLLRRSRWRRLLRRLKRG
jgi:hypothetical protein